MINLKNKRAAEMAISTMVMLVLAILVLAVVALGFWKGWDYVFGSMGLLPNDLNKAVVACQSYASSPILASSFCEKKELTINKVKGTYNCNDIYYEAIKTMSQEGIGFQPDMGKCTAVTKSCTGTATSCTALTSEEDCTAQKICSWLA